MTFLNVSSWNCSCWPLGMLLPPGMASICRSTEMDPPKDAEAPDEEVFLTSAFFALTFVFFREDNSDREVTANSPYEASITSPSSSSMPTFLPMETILPRRSESIRTTLCPIFRELSFAVVADAGLTDGFLSGTTGFCSWKFTFPFRAEKSFMTVFFATISR